MVSRPEPAMDTVGESFGARVVAFAIDAVVVGGVCGALWVVGALVRSGVDGSLSLLAGGVSAVGVVLWLLTWLVVTALAFAYFATGHAVAGQSPGKRMADVVVATGDGGPCGWGPAATRAAVLLAPAPVVAALSLVGGFVGALAGAAVVAAWLLVELGAAALDDDGRRLGDRLAGTVVAAESLATV